MSLEIVQPKGRLEGGGGAGGKIGEGGQHCGSRKVTSVVCQFLFSCFFVGGGCFCRHSFELPAAGSLGVVVFVLVYRSQRVPDTRLLPLPIYHPV